MSDESILIANHLIKSISKGEKEAFQFASDAVTPTRDVTFFREWMASGPWGLMAVNAYNAKTLSDKTVIDALDKLFNSEWKYHGSTPAPKFFNQVFSVKKAEYVSVKGVFVQICNIKQIFEGITDKLSSFEVSTLVDTKSAQLMLRGYDWVFVMSGSKPLLEVEL